MKLAGHTVLITGGGTGIGLCFAEAFLKAGSRVLVCGRRKEKLDEARRRCPELEARVGDVASEEGRAELVAWAESRGVDVLVNNAGMQREIDFTKGLPALTAGDNEIRTNFEGPVFLTAALVPWLASRPESAIVNVSSALGFVPLAMMPVYCATKAAMHSFTLSLRRQLEPRVKVFEVIPPTVDTDLDRGARARRGQVDRGIAPEALVDAVMRRVAEDEREIAVGQAAHLAGVAHEPLETIFRSMNGRYAAT